MRRLIGAIARRLGVRRHPAPQEPEPAPPTFRQALDARGLDVPGWLEKKRVRGARSLYVDGSPARIAWLRKRFPVEASSVRDAAETLLRHEFDILGNGPFTPIDPERSPHGDGYQPIDWRLDPRSKQRFPHGFPCREWNLAEMAPKGADVKAPWELGRLQHWVVLSQAALLFGDERFAAEIVRQAIDFSEANPVGVGVQWVCTMDVALRTVSWAIATELLDGFGGLGDSDRKILYEGLYEHGAFVRTHLENFYEVTSNHYLSNLLGLLFAGAVFDDLEPGAQWWRFARGEIAREIEKQVLPDGADFESSIPYHRLVTELLLAAAHLAAHRGDPFDPAFRMRLASMVEYLAGTLRPDGVMPQVGDADDGRLHLFSGYGTRPPEDPRHVFAPAAGVLGDPRWLEAQDALGPFEAAWWGIDHPSAIAAEPATVTRLWPDAGVAVHRAGGDYLLVTNGRVGTQGFGNHKHNDQLGFELHLRGAALVVDPGSFVYTADPSARNRFRGTGAHSTVRIDHEEQNELRPDWLFRLFQSGDPPELAIEARGDAVIVRGRHTGYTRLSDPVVHERELRFEPSRPRLEVTDRFSGRGSHEVEWRIQLAPGVEPRPDGDRRWRLETRDAAFLLCLEDDVALRVETAHHSPSYGRRLECFALSWRDRVRLDRPVERRFTLLGADASSVMES